MSYIISRQQYLAPYEQRNNYESRFIDDTNLEVENINVYFGHPLYMILNDVIHFTSKSEESIDVAIVPDGCMSIVFAVNGERINSYLCGAIDEIRSITVNPDSEYIVMRFLPGCGNMITGESALSYANICRPLEEVVEWGKQVIGILSRDIPLRERVGLISKVIRVYQNGEESNYLVKFCTERIFRARGNIKIETLAEETGFTSRHIGKMFERCVGMPPKLFSQIIRLQISMSKILSDSDSLLVNIAVDSGYFDHAHMNRMYKKLIHCSSGDFRKNKFANLDYSKIDCYIPDTK